ncbi:MAG: hypothetical protein ABI898_01130 [Sphingomonadales bacterium]
MAIMGAPTLVHAQAVSPIEKLSPALPPVPSLREQATIRDRWLAERLDTLVPTLMRENGIDLWILVAREYAEDPVVSTMLDAESFHA